MNLHELEEIAKQTNEQASSAKHCIRVCLAASCQSSGGDKVFDRLKQISSDNNKQEVHLKGVGCMGLCSAGPLVRVSTRGSEVETLYRDVQQEDADELLANVDRGPVERLVCSTDIPFFRRQQRIVLENSGEIDPADINDYIAAGGYSALVRAVTEMSPKDVLREVMESGLRGRGGGGYPAGLKWATVAKAIEPQRYVICNGDEGDPGAFMDRAVLESDPHRVLEGMALAGYAVGAQHGYAYIRAEYPHAVERLNAAICAANKLGLLGSNICETPFSIDIDVRLAQVPSCVVRKPH